MLKDLRQLASESLVYGLSGIIARFLNIFLVPIYTRVFTPEEYGVVSLVTSALVLISTFVVLALDNSAARWYWDTEDSADRKSTMASWAWCQLIVSSVVATILVAFSQRLGDTLVGRPDAGTYFAIVGLALPLSALGNVATNWLRLQRRPWATLAYALGTNLLTILLTITFVVVLGYGIAGIFLAQLLTAGVSTLAAVFLLGDWIHPRHFERSRLGEMLRYGLPLIPAAIAFWVVGFADRYFVQLYTTTSEVGLYQVGSTVAALVALATGAFQQAWGPFALSIHKRDNAKQVYASVFIAYLWLASLLSTALALFAAEVIRIFATDQYSGAATIVGLLCFSYVMIGLTYIASIGPAILKISKLIGLAIMLAAIVNIALNVILVPPMGKTGSAVATLVSQSVVPIYLFYRSQQLYPIPYRFKAGLGIIALGLTISSVGVFLDFESYWLGIVVRILLLSLFVPTLFLLRIVTPDQARHLLRFRAVD